MLVLILTLICDLDFVVGVIKSVHDTVLGDDAYVYLIPLKYLDGSEVVGRTREGLRRNGHLSTNV